MFRVGVAILLVLAGCDRLLQLDQIPEVPKPDAPAPPSSWASGRGGWYHMCGIREDGTLWCWGRNVYGQLGTPSTMLSERDTPLQVGTDTWLAVAADEYHTCAIKSDHSLSCWGNNGDAALGAGTFDNMQGPVTIDGTSWVSVAAGVDSGCALDDSGQISCWGDNSRGELGQPAQTGAFKPQAIAGTWKSLAVSGQHGCAIDTSDHVTCWGNNGYGESGMAPNPAPPNAIGGNDTYTKLALGEEFSCGLTTMGHLRCWGEGVFGQLGNDTTNSSNVPVAVDNDSDGWIDLDAGDRHACALKADHTLWCWGDNRQTQLGADASVAFRTLPSQVTGGGGTYAALALGPTHTCAIAGSDHRMWCAGLAGGGQLGTTGSHLSPAQVSGTWTSVALGRRITCAIDATSHLSCWGDNGSGALGDGTHADHEEPHAVMSSSTWSGVSVGDHVCALDSANQLFCWGPNYSFQLGDGTPNEHDTPTATSQGTTPLAHVSSSDHTCVLNSTAVTCWGENYFQQAGMGANPEPPTSIPGMYDKIAAGSEQTCAQVSGGGIQCWGNNDSGNLGVGNNSAHSGPQQVSGTSAIVDELWSGDDHTCARQGGTVYCWGWNYFGQIGDMTTNNAFVPVTVAPIAPASSWRSVAVGSVHTCAVDNMNRLYCWGRNDSGQLGDGTLHDRHEPTQAGSDADWDRVTAGEKHTCAFKTDGSLWCWGGNTAGEIGDGTAWRSDLQVVP